MKREKEWYNSSMMKKKKSKMGKVILICAAASILTFCSAGTASAKGLPLDLFIGFSQDDDNTESQPDLDDKYTVYSTSDAVPVRNSPGCTKNNQIAQLNTGDSVYVQDKSEGTYWYVYSEDLDLSGYVNSNYLVK